MQPCVGEKEGPAFFCVGVVTVQTAGSTLKDHLAEKKKILMCRQVGSGTGSQLPMSKLNLCSLKNCQIALIANFSFLFT